MAWNEEVLKRLSAIASGTGTDLTPYLTTGNTNTGNTVTQLQTANTNLTTINTTSAATNTALGTTNGLLSGLAVTLNTANLEAVGLRGGVLYLAANYTAAVAAGANRDTIVITGAKPALIFTRVVQSNGASVNSTIFQTPTYTGGTAGVVYGANRVGPVANTATFFIGPTVTATGTQIVPTSYLLGSPGGLLTPAGSSGGSIGAPLYLPASTTFLFRVNNSDTTAANIYAQIEWYEGTL